MSRTIACTPWELPQAYRDRFNTGDLAGLLRLYEPNATLIDAHGAALRGDDLKAALEAQLALGVPIEVTRQHATIADDLALLVTGWTMRGLTPTGGWMTLSGQSADVARRGADGRWHYAIDDPFGIVCRK